MEDNFETNKTSKYNSAVAQLMRLDNLWQICHTASISGNYFKWNYALDKIYVELAADLKESDPKNREYANLINEFNQTGIIFSKQIKGFEVDSTNDKAIKQYPILLKKELWLKRLQNTLGKGTKWDEGEDDYMDG